MPWEYTIDTSRNLGFVKASGVMTAEVLADGLRRASQDPKFHPDLNVFADYTEVTDWQVSTDFLSHLSNSRRLSDKSKTAIWTTGPLSYGMGRAFASWVNVGQVRIFTDKDEAWAWLNEGVPPEKAIT